MGLPDKIGIESHVIKRSLARSEEGRLRNHLTRTTKGDRSWSTRELSTGGRAEGCPCGIQRSLGASFTSETAQEEAHL